MKRVVIIMICALTSCYSQAQIISGNVSDDQGQAVPFASVYLDELFEGASSDAEGNFSFKTTHKGAAVLVVSAIGFETAKQDLANTIALQKLNIVMYPAAKALNPVVISAGSFDASDQSKTTMLEPIDIVTNAGAAGDIFKAIETLPGVSKVGDQTGLFVRGGDAHETKVIIDGTISEKPFFSDIPNIASRSRFDPFMFKGTNFTTGGYSAEYGQALSSVLILQTQDIPDGSATNLGVNMAGVTLSHQQVWDEKTAVIGEVGYSNLKLLFNSMPQNTHWQKMPEGYNTNWAVKHRTKNGMFKSFVQHQRGKIGIYTNNLEQPENPNLFTNDNNNTYWNTSYKGTLNDNWGVFSGVSFNSNKDDIMFAGNVIQTSSQSLQGKVTLYNEINEMASMKIGAETISEKDETSYNTFVSEISDQYSALYAETDFNLGENWAFRAGLRSEYSSLLQTLNWAPRGSLAYKTGEKSSVSLAYGLFYQKPEEDYLYNNRGLNFEKSTHYIANYQWISEGQSFRVELYDKRYNQLTNEELDGLSSNDGEGFSRGVDVFWKDKRTIDQLNYWVSYSYVDGKRKYKDYPTLATPEFITNHTLNVVANYSIRHLGLNPGLSYTFASGRSYFNPQNNDFLTDKTKAYHNVSLNLSYLTTIFGNFAVAYASVSNPFGFEQVFGYDYSLDGNSRVAKLPAANTTFFLGFFVTIAK